MQLNLESAPMPYRLQRARPEHRALLQRIYACQREQELRGFGWSNEQCRLFLALQWRARNASYAAQYPDALDQIIVRYELPVGHLLTAETPHTLNLVDVALLPEYQNRGLGTRVLRDLQRACVSRGQTISLHVACDNRARELYARLGFVAIEKDEIFTRMEWAGD